jgi:hypothetical protein
MRAGNVLNSILSGTMGVIDAPENFADSIFRFLTKSLCSRRQAKINRTRLLREAVLPSRPMICSTARYCRDTVLLFGAYHFKCPPSDHR